MNGAGNQFLARPAFPENQNVRRRVGNLFNRVEYFEHFPACADHAAKGMV